MAGFLQDFLCSEEDKLICEDEAAPPAALLSTPAKQSQKCVLASQQAAPSQAASSTPSPKKKCSSPKSTSKTKAPKTTRVSSLAGRGKDVKKRAERGTAGTFAGRRMPPSDPEAMEQFVKIRDAYRKMVADNGKPDIRVSQTDFWKKLSAADDHTVAVAKYIREHWKH